MPLDGCVCVCVCVSEEPSLYLPLGSAPLSLSTVVVQCRSLARQATSSLPRSRFLFPKYLFPQKKVFSSSEVLKTCDDVLHLTTARDKKRQLHKYEI